MCHQKQFDLLQVDFGLMTKLRHQQFIFTDASRRVIN